MNKFTKSQEAYASFLYKKNNSLHCYPCRAMCCFARNELLNHVVPVVVNRYSLVRGTAIFAK